MRSKRFTRRLLPATLVFVLAGCSVFSSPDREYRSNERVLDTVARQVGYAIDDGFLALTRVEVADDAVTFHYRGVEFPGDQAWVVRFSEKSTELEPASLATVAAAIDVIREEKLQPEFVADEPERAILEGVEIESAAYTFHSTLAPAGRQGRGVLAAFRRVENGLPVVYQIKLDNHGDREQLTRADLAPFLAPFRTAAVEAVRAPEGEQER